MKSKSCETCHYWDNSVQLAAAEPDTTGACRAQAPVADDRSGKARWPFTEDSDWCGSYVADNPKSSPEAA